MMVVDQHTTNGFEGPQRETPHEVKTWKRINWFAVQTKPWREKLGASNIEMLGLESFFPQCQRNRKICGRVQKITEPLFPGYFFARFCPSVWLQIIRYSHGILRVVSSGATPIPVDEDIVKEIRGREDDSGYVALSEPVLRTGDRVKIEFGPFEGMTGIFQRELDGKDRVLLLLEALGQAQVVLGRDSVRWEADSR
jgi:transcriptional antiterminator RfaH